MEKIILVEDDPDIQDVTRLVLERAGYDVTIFANGEPLLQLQFDLPNLFILDKQLSGVDGLEICRFLKSQEATKNIPVIILSASPHIEQLSKLAGADDFLEKPFSTKILRDLVGRYVMRNSAAGTH